MVDEVPFDEQLVKSYLSISGNLDITRSFLNEKYLKNISELFGFASTIQTDLEEIGESSGFHSHLKSIRALPAKVALQVLTTPAAYHWNSMTRQLLNAVISGRNSTILDRYLDFLDLDLSDGLNTHLNDFGRFSLSAHILAQVEFNSHRAVKIKLPTTLPGTKLVLLSLGPCENQSNSLVVYSLGFTEIKKLYNLSQSDTTETARILFNGNESVLITKLHSRKGQFGEAVIDAFDPCLNLPYIESYPRVRSQRNTDKFIDALNNAFDHLEQFNNITAAEIELVTSSITLMDTSEIDAEMCSGTSSSIFGAYFLSETNNPLYLAEMLLHEFCHNKLRLLEEIHPFLHPESINTPRFYSPWRDDPRPLDGIQHGLYVFSSIAYFWLDIYLSKHSSVEDRELAQRRIATLLIQLRYAEKEFTNYAKLTEIGRTFIEEIKQRIQFLEEKTLGWKVSTLLPFFSGIVKDGKLRKIPLIKALKMHQLNWKKSYGTGGTKSI